MAVGIMRQDFTPAELLEQHLPEGAKADAPAAGLRLWLRPRRPGLGALARPSRGLPRGLRPHRLAALAAALLLGLCAARAAAAPVEDAYLAGYAAAVLKLEFRLQAASLTVRDGVITVAAADLAGIDRNRIIRALSQIEGVRRVEVTTVAAAARPPAPPAAQPAPSAAQPAPPPAPPVALAAGGGVESEVKAEGWTGFPRRELFDPLTADPRWPDFSIELQNWYSGSPELRSATAASLGGIVPLLESDVPFLGGRWQLGFLGAAFVLLDRGSSSQDLIDADYYIGVPVSYRDGPFSALLRYYHESSHLGDELLLRGTGIQRVNLSYENVDLKLSYDLGEQFRVYGGTGYIVRSEPHLSPWSLQVGGEFTGAHAFFDLLRPVAAVDLQSRAYTAWNPDFSARAGVQIDSPFSFGRNAQLLLEYYNGRSQYGQFYNEQIEYYGFGAHLHF